MDLFRIRVFLSETSGIFLNFMQLEVKIIDGFLKYCRDSIGFEIDGCGCLCMCRGVGEGDKKENPHTSSCEWRKLQFLMSAVPKPYI